MVALLLAFSVNEPFRTMKAIAGDLRVSDSPSAAAKATFGGCRRAPMLMGFALALSPCALPRSRLRDVLDHHVGVRALDLELAVDLEDELHARSGPPERVDPHRDPGRLLLGAVAARQLALLLHDAVGGHAGERQHAQLDLV